MSFLRRVKNNFFHSGHDLMSDIIETKRVKLVNFIIFIGVPIFSFFVVVNYQLGFVAFAITNVVILVLFLASFFSLRYSMDFLNRAIFLVLVGMLLTHSTSLFQGGILNSGFLWFFLFPILAMILNERKVALRWIYFLLSLILGFYFYVSITGFELPYDPNYLIFVFVSVGVEAIIVSYWHQNQMRFEADLAEKKSMLEDLTVDLEQRVEDEVKKSREKDERISHQSKLAALGEMMNNIAHQWKQPLGTINIIVQNIQLANALEQDDIDIDSSLEEIANQTKLMNQTIYDFMNFSKPVSVEEAFDLNGAIQTTLDLIHPRLTAENINVNYQPGHESYEIFGRKNEFMHILMNIFSNAREALLENSIDKPWIEVSVFRDHERVVLQISDNAGGISSDDIDKVFDVYYSTKTSTGGTGLGLYMCKKIIEQGMQGSLSVSNTNMGALFELRFDILN